MLTSIGTSQPIISMGKPSKRKSAARKVEATRKRFANGRYGSNDNAEECMSISDGKAQEIDTRGVCVDLSIFWF